MLVDAHNHLHDERLRPHLSQVIEAARRAGVSHVVVNGTCEADWPQVAAMAVAQPRFVVPCFGLHPWSVGGASAGWRDALLRHLEAVPSGIGEIGLDRWVEPRDEAAQEGAFAWQMDLARARDLPVSIHCVRAWGWLLELLDRHPPPARGYLLHAFGGSLETLREHLRRGAYFSIAGNVAQERKAALRETVRQIPAERLLVETDAPDIPPPPEVHPTLLHDTDGNSLNQPANLPTILRYVADLRGEDPEALAAQVEANARRFFGPLLGE